MSELKAYIGPHQTDHTLTEYYLKSKADKVIADLEESHKREVEQLLMEIVGLKLQNVSELLKETREWLIESQKMHKRCADNAIKVIRHQKFKRCLAKSEACMHKRWRTDEGFDYARSTRHMNKWLELAEKFKEGV